MRKTVMTTLVLVAVGLSGCSQISSLWKDKSDKTVSAKTETLRTTPEQDYSFGDGAHEVELYQGASSYAGYKVELYDPSQYYYYGYNDRGVRSLTVAERSDPRKAAFVKLNGASQATDWQNCERRHNGYLYLSDYDLRLDPEFEVCMRNNGYVLTTELGVSSSGALTAQNSGLRGYAQSSGYSAAR